MNKYYLIPTTEDSVYLNGETLRNILKNFYPKLVKREEERICILYSTSPLISMPEREVIRYNKHNLETEKMYDKMLVPEFLIAYGNDYCAEEFLTKAKITSKYPSALGIRSVSKKEALEYYYNSNYSAKIQKYFNTIKIAFSDIYKLNGYIEGEIDGQSITGNFKGKIKVKNSSKI